MPCFSYFCCGYTLRTGGQVIGYISILIYSLLSVLCVVFLWCMKNRIDESQTYQQRSLYNHVSNWLKLRSNHDEIESSIQELKIYSILFLVYLLFLMLGFLSSFYLITGSKLRKPNHLWLWLIYQILFVIITAGVISLLITIKDERYGLLAYIKNYFLRLLISSFTLIYIGFVTLLIYFWLSVLSLHTSLKKFNHQNSRQMSSKATAHHNNDGKPDFTSMRMIPIEMVNSSSTSTVATNIENEITNDTQDQRFSGRFFILHV